MNEIWYFVMFVKDMVKLTVSDVSDRNVCTKFTLTQGLMSPVLTSVQSLHSFVTVNDVSNTNVCINVSNSGRTV